MKRSLNKISMRAIKKAPGRFIAIMCIVMLGSALLSGLKITRPDMLHTLDIYNGQSNFYDYQIVSTLGLTQEDIDYFAGLEGAESASGSISADALYDLPSGSDRVFKTHMITQGVNELILHSGRMPRNAGECLMDGQVYGEDMLGTTVSLSETNSEDTLDMFSRRSFTVVGIVDSPLYLSFTRGTTSLGSGSVSGYIYLPQESFDVDYFTEAYICLPDTGNVYTDEYDDNVDAFMSTIEDAADERGKIRHDDIVSEANEEYDDAYAEYSDGLSEYYTEKAKADRELADARKELEDGQRELDDAKIEIEDGWVKLNDGQKELDDAKAELEDGEAEYENGLKEYEDGKAQFDAAVGAASGQLADAKKQLDEAQAQYEQGLAQYNAAVEQFEAAYPGVPLPEDFIQQKQVLDAGKAELDKGLAQYNNGLAQLSAGQAQLDAAKKQLEDARKELDDGWTEYNDGLAEIEENRATLEQAEIDYADGVKELKDGWSEFYTAEADALKEFADARAELSDAEIELADALDEINSIEKPDVFVFDRYSNAGYASYNNDSSIVDGIANVFPIFFFLVAALVCMTTMNRMVDEQRTQIGTLKSIGYTPREIMNGYLIYAALASASGGILGVIIGFTLFPKVIWMGYSIMYSFMPISLTCDFVLAALVIAAFMACCILVTYYSCRHELKLAPAELIRPRTPRAGKRIFLERIPFIWNHFSFLRKVSARNIFRYKKRMFMMILGISGCMALLLTAFGISDSISGLAETQFDEISIYDAQAVFKNSMSDEDEAEFLSHCGDTVDSAIFLSMYTVDAKVGESLKTVYLVGTDEDGMENYMDFHLDGEKIEYPGLGETIINDNLARLLKVEVGDTIVLQNSELDSIPLKVSGIFFNVMNNYAYVTSGTLRAANGFSSDINSAYLNFAPGEDAYEAGAVVSGSDYVISTSVNEEARISVHQSLRSLDYVVALVAVCAGALAFIVLYNLTNINITERIREIATIKVLGFRSWETASYVFRENLILTLMGMAAGIPLGIWLHSFVMSHIKVDMISYDVKIVFTSYVLALALTLLFAVIVDFFMFFHLEKINMAESLKSVE